MKKKEELLISVIIGRLKKFRDGKTPISKGVKILKKMIEIDENSGEEACQRRGYRPGEEV